MAGFDSSYKNEILSGLFIVTAVMILIYGVFSVGRYEPEGSTYTAYARFRSVGNLTENAIVKYEGVPVGTVKEISLQPDHSILVTMELESDFHPRSNDRALITSSGFLGADYVSIRGPRPGQEAEESLSAEVIQPNEEGEVIIPGEEPFDMFGAMAGFKKLLDENRDSVGIIVERIRSTVDSDTFIDNIHGTVANAEGVTAEAEILIANANEVVEENRPVIKETIENARDVTENAKSVTEKADTLVTTASTAVARVDSLIERNENNIDETLDNANVTMKNARVFSYAIAEKPWRLVWKDKKREKAITEGDTSAIVPSEF